MNESIDEFKPKEKWHTREAEACLHLLLPPALAHVTVDLVVPEYTFSQVIIAIKNRFATFAVPWQEMHLVSAKFLVKARGDKHAMRKLFSLWNEKLGAFLRVCEEVDSKDLSSCSEKELFSLYEKFYSAYLDVFRPSLLAEPISFLPEKLLEKAIAESVSPKEAIGKFTQLASCTRFSFVAEEKIELLELYARILENRKLRPLLEQKRTELLMYNLGPVLEELKAHSQKYFWIKNNYLRVQVLGVRDFLNQILEFHSEKLEPRKEIDYLRNQRADAVAAREGIEKIFENPSEVHLYCNLIDDTIYLQDVRKKANLMGDHYLSLFLKEFSKRAKIPYELMQFTLNGEELRKALSGKLSEKILSERREFCSAVVEAGGRTRVLEGRAAEEKYLEIAGAKGLQQLSELHGSCANLGIAVGPVRIVKTMEDIHAFKKGEILVAPKTTPDYLLAMKRAAAIVTDIGGVTCHAAIVSRELGLPCVIGTRIATRALKNGDLVEVRAHHGLVRRLT